MTLIERLEALTGPCRECDCLIALEAGWDVQNMSLPLSDLVKRFGIEWLHEAATEYNSVYRTLPAYTASIDAAMTLVPEGWEWSVDSDGECGLYKDDMAVCAVGNTPTIALCIAALKATQ